LPGAGPSEYRLQPDRPTGHDQGMKVTVAQGYKPQMHKDLLNSEYVCWKAFLQAADVWDRRQIEAYQLRQVSKIVSFAYENSRGYRELFDRYGASPDEIGSLEDFRKFPFVTKEMLRDNLEEFAVSMPGSRYVTTGGSTGIPFGFYRNDDAFSKELASKAHQYHRIGWKEGQRQLVLRGLPIPGEDHVEYRPEFNELRCSSYHLQDDAMELYRRYALEYEPQWVRCYPSSGYVFAKFLKHSGRAFPRVKGVLCASENLYDFQKELLGEVFGGRVFSHYGHYELSALASFCEYEDTYHVLPQYGYVELIDSQGQPVTEPGRQGEIVATSFIMRATPFIRYRTQDVAVLKGWGCQACGRPYQIWERIEGRLQEFIVTGSGRRISMTAVNMHDDTFDHIKQFQFHQRQMGRATLRYVPKPGCTAEDVQRIRARLLAKLGDDMELTMQAVEDIPLTARGKHRFLIQQLDIGEFDR